MTYWDRRWVAGVRPEDVQSIGEEQCLRDASVLNVLSTIAADLGGRAKRYQRAPQSVFDFEEIARN